MAWGELTYAKPLTEKQMEDYELKPGPGNPDRVRPSITARLKEGTRGQEPPKEPDVYKRQLRLLCLAGILRPARFIFLPHAVRGTAFPAVLLKLAAFGLRAIMARRAVLSGILVLKPQTSGWCGGRSFPFSRSGAIAPGILRRPRPLKIPFVRFLSDDVSLLSKPRANMARSVLCPVHFLFFVLRAGGHNGVQLGILREAVNKRDGGIPEEQQPFAGIGMGHIGKLVGADPKLFG